MQSGSTFYTVNGIYHPPQGTQEGVTNTTFLDELTGLLMEVKARHRNIIILGDFNMHIDNSEDPHAQVLIDMLQAFNLKQHILFPTHNSRTYTRSNSNRKQHLPSHGISTRTIHI